MKSARMDWLRLGVWSLLVVVIVAGGFWFQRAKRDAMERAYPLLKLLREHDEQSDKVNEGWRKRIAKEIRSGKMATATNNWRKFRTGAGDMTESEKADVAKKFNEKFLPALQRWGAAYTNRIPFDLSEVTLDKFHSAFGPHQFTFMIGSTTLTFVTGRDPDAPAKVAYLMVRQAAVEMNSLPGSGFTPDLSVPITSGEIIGMVKADSGVEFKSSEVIIRPTAKASAMNGGAFVDILPAGADPNNALDYKISMTFDAHGKLVDYERDPRF